MLKYHVFNVSCPHICWVVLPTFKFTILLSQPPKSWNFTCGQPCSANENFVVDLIVCVCVFKVGDFFKFYQQTDHKYYYEYRRACPAIMQGTLGPSDPICLLWAFLPCNPLPAFLPIHFALMETLNEAHVPQTSMKVSSSAQGTVFMALRNSSI